MRRPRLHTERIRNFGDLVDAVGELVSRRGSSLYLFRGQHQAHVAPTTGHESILPKFWRQTATTAYVLNDLVRRAVDNVGLRDHGDTDELAAEALLAHYEIVPTRMLDTTQVLHVAATFALAKDWVQEPAPAVVYVFDTSDLKSFLVASTVTYACRRPQRQAAWAVCEPEPSDAPVNYARHALARFDIHAEDAATFWDSFAPYPQRWLVGEDRELKRLLRELPSW